MTGVARPDAETASAIRSVEERRQRALVAVDLAELDRVFDDSLVHVHAPGVVHTKAQLLEHTETRRAYLEIIRGDLDIRLVGDVAVVVGSITNRLRTSDGGERTLAGMATQVLARDASGAWRFISFQMTPYGEQAWGALPSQSTTEGSSGGSRSGG